MQYFTIKYEFKHPSMGFQNSVTVEAESYEKAVMAAKDKVMDVYGGIWGNLKKFTFK